MGADIVYRLTPKAEAVLHGAIACGTPVLVHWLDATFAVGEDTGERGVEYVSAGFLIQDDDEWVAIGQSRPAASAETVMYLECLSIPRSTVRQVTVI